MARNVPHECMNPLERDHTVKATQIDVDWFHGIGAISWKSIIWGRRCFLNHLFKPTNKKKILIENVVDVVTTISASTIPLEAEYTYIDT